MQVVSKHPYSGARAVSSVAFRLAETGTFREGREVIAALRSLWFDVSAVSSAEVVASLDATCRHAVSRERVGQDKRTPPSSRGVEFGLKGAPRNRAVPPAGGVLVKFRDG